MHNIQIKLDENDRGLFFIEENGETLAKMEFSIEHENLTVFHTEVNEKLRGNGIASQLLSKMVDYARKNNKKVIPLCSFVKEDFEKHPEQYADIWNQS